MQKLFLLLALLLAPALSGAAEQAGFVAEYPAGKPLALALDEDGNIYAAQEDGSVIVLDEKGGRKARLTCSANGGQAALRSPAGMAYYGGSLYITDSSLDKVVICGRDGGYIGSFGEKGSGAKQFKDIEDIAVMGGVIYVVDKGNRRVQVFGPGGEYSGSVGAFAQGDMRALLSPASVAFDEFGNIFIADENLKKVISLKPSLKHHLNLVGMDEPARVRASGGGLYVADRGSQKILKYDLRGNRVLSFGGEGMGGAQFSDITDIEVSAAGGMLYVSDLKKGTVQVFSVEGAPLLAGSPPTHVRWTGDLRMQSDMVRSAGGVLYSVNTGSGEIFEIRDGKVERTIRAEGVSPVSVDVDGDGFIWALDRGGGRVVKLDGEGRVLMSVGSPGRKDGELSHPSDIAISGGMVIYVSDTGNKRLQRFGTDGAFMGVVDKGNTFRLEQPTSLALAPDGRLFVLDEKKKFVAVYSQEGNPMYTMGGPGEGAGKFKEPKGIAASRDEVFVVDRRLARVQAFGLDGEYRREFGAEGAGMGDFREPSSIAAEGEALFVADTGNGRVQFLETAYTPAPPGYISASGGMRKISLDWAPNTDISVDGYRIYRSESKTSGFAETATAGASPFEDTSVEPGKTYYYCVAAVSSVGREGPKACSGMASALRYDVGPPKGLFAAPKDDSMELSWSPVQDPMLSHYLVYRKDKGEFMEVARVSANSYVDRPVLPDKGYEYLVTAVSTDLLESERTATLAVRSAPDKEAPVAVEVLETEDFFASAYGSYEKEGAGKIKVVNNTGEAFSALTLSFMMTDLSDSPVVTEIKELPAGGELEFVLRPLLDLRSRFLGEDMPVQAEVKIAYTRNDEPKEYITTFTVRAYEKHRLKWDRPEKFAAMVTPGDPAVQDFAKKVLSQYGGESDPLMRAAALFDALGVVGVAFREDPAAPYRSASEKPGEVDSVQYPQETLSRKSGDVDDIAALYSALLEASGIRTAVLFPPGQVVPMFATTLKSGGASTGAETTVDYDGLLWVPVDVRLVGGPFTKAWESGSLAYRNLSGDGPKPVDIRFAWESFIPYDLPDSGWRADLVRREEIEAKYGADFSRMKKARIENMTAALLARLKANPDDVDAALQLSFIYAEFGLLEDAAGVIEAALAMNPKDPALRNNLGNVHFLKGSHEEAKAAYQSAAALDPDDAFVLVNLARCNLKLGDRAEASRLFRQAAKMNKDVFRAYKKLAAYLM